MGRRTMLLIRFGSLYFLGSPNELSTFSDTAKPSMRTMANTGSFSSSGILAPPSTGQPKKPQSLLDKAPIFRVAMRQPQTKGPSLLDKAHTSNAGAKRVYTPFYTADNKLPVEKSSPELIEVHNDQEMTVFSEITDVDKEIQKLELNQRVIEHKDALISQLQHNKKSEHTQRTPPVKETEKPSTERPKTSHSNPRQSRAPSSSQKKVFQMDSGIHIAVPSPFTLDRVAVQKGGSHQGSSKKGTTPITANNEVVISIASDLVKDTWAPFHKSIPKDPHDEQVYPTTPSDLEDDGSGNYRYDTLTERQAAAITSMYGVTTTTATTENNDDRSYPGPWHEELSELSSSNYYYEAVVTRERRDPPLVPREGGSSQHASRRQPVEAAARVVTAAPQLVHHSTQTSLLSKEKQNSEKQILVNDKRAKFEQLKSILDRLDTQNRFVGIERQSTALDVRTTYSSRDGTGHGSQTKSDPPETVKGKVRQSSKSTVKSKLLDPSKPLVTASSPPLLHSKADTLLSPPLPPPLVVTQPPSTVHSGITETVSLPIYQNGPVKVAPQVYPSSGTGSTKKKLAVAVLGWDTRHNVGGSTLRLQQPLLGVRPEECRSSRQVVAPKDAPEVTRPVVDAPPAVVMEVMNSAPPTTTRPTTKTTRWALFSATNHTAT